MAKKKESKATDKDKDVKKTTGTGPKGKSPTGKASKAPKRSGEVKGPMDREKGKTSKTSAKAKKPSKINQPKEKEVAGESAKAAKSKKSDTGKAAKETKKNLEKGLPGSKEALPGPKEALPKPTAESKTAEKTGESKSETAKKAAKFKDPVVDEEKSTSARASTTAKSAKSQTGTKKTAKTSGKASAEKKETKSSTKKSSGTTKRTGARKKAEETQTSSTEDLKETAKKTAKEISKRIIPDEDTQKTITKTAKDLMPDKEDVKKTARKIAENIAPDPDNVEKAIDKVLPEEKGEKKAGKVKPVTKDSKKKEKKENDSTMPASASLFSDYDVHLFKEGKHFHLYNKFGSHVIEHDGVRGVYFALWAPNAKMISVIGNFNHWDRQAHPMNARWDHSGIWEAFIPEAEKGDLYKYFIVSNNGYEVEKGDPYAFTWETPPNTASMIWDLDNTWNDKDWLESREQKAGNPQPVSVYELHLGSWKRVPEEDLRSLTYREMAEQLPSYLKEMGFTHVEFMPVMEHPFFGSWGYQITGYFAPSSRFGNPQDFMYLVDQLHQAGIGVILDWVPSHFPSDMHGLHYFDGTFLYEHADPRKGFHPDWQSYIFNYGRNEVRSFLISNALFWLDKFHVDGLRVDAVASMLYLDYSRNEGEWEPNEFGGRENLEAISFLKEFNETVYKEYPDAITIAEESTAWPMVSKPTYIGGLGFGMKWMMGWMHDTLLYFQKDPVHRRHHQNTITFSTNYAFTENFMLPLSHDEVVYGKQAILNKMPGDQWNKFANLRSLYSYMFAHPGTKLLFMGAEFGQPSEWNHDGSLEWHLTHEEPHRKVQETLKELNRLYKTEPALYEKSFSYEGFEWIDHNDDENSIISFLRKGENRNDDVIVVCNFTPVPRENYRIGVPEKGQWQEIFNSDEERFGGSNLKNLHPVESQEIPLHNKEQSIPLSLPPMGVIYLKRTGF